MDPDTRYLIIATSPLDRFGPRWCFRGSRTTCRDTAAVRLGSHLDYNGFCVCVSGTPVERLSVFCCVSELLFVVISKCRGTHKELEFNFEAAAENEVGWLVLSILTFFSFHFRSE